MMTSTEHSSSMPHHGREKRKLVDSSQGQGRKRSSSRDGSRMQPDKAADRQTGKKGKSSTSGGGVNAGVSGIKRLTKEHSFLRDVADVRAMEQGLLQLLADFHSGKLRAFSDGSTFEKMDQIRGQQERLARLHFELDVHQDLHRLGTEEARSTANENLSKLIDQLHQLSTSIQMLQTGPADKDDRKAKLSGKP